MIIKELQLLTESLWNVVKTDPAFFAPISIYAKNLAEFDYSQLSRQHVKELKFYGSKITDFWDYWEGSTSRAIPANEKLLTDIVNRIGVLNNSDDKSLIQLANEVKPKAKKASQGGGAIFIGHGRSKLYTQVQLFLQNDYGLKTLVFENESRAGQSIVDVLKGFLDEASFAVLVMTGEDETGTGSLRARQNVIHEVGLFQGRLGFEKVFILKQSEVEEFSNVAGLQYIPFHGDSIDQTFYQLQRALKQHGLIK